MYQRHQLSHKDAARIVAAIQKRLEPKKKGAAIAVCDAHGELLAFLRTDGCKLPSINIAMNKAFTAAREGKPSWDIGQSSKEKNWPMSNFGDMRYTAWGGGVTIVYKGQVVGGVGVSGLPEEEDMILAKMGADLIQG
jgi:glc operon protein GlcG